MLARGSSGPDVKKVAAVTLSAPQELGIGFLAGVLSRLVTTPLSVITVRLQVTNENDDDIDSAQPDAGIISTMREIHSEDGIAGFWKGNAGSYMPFELLSIFASVRIPIHDCAFVKSCHYPIAFPTLPPLIPPGKVS